MPNTLEAIHLDCMRKRRLRRAGHRQDLLAFAILAALWLALGTIYGGAWASW